MVSSTPSMYSVREPKPDYKGVRRSRHKQIARIICHLRDQAHGTAPRLHMPTRWMVECLVFNACTDDILASGDWETIVTRTLENMRTLAHAQLRSTYCFTRGDGRRPLFPNEDLFDEWDVFRFCQALLEHLDKQLNP